VSENTNVMSLLSMKELGSMLPAGSFFRVHKSYIVNFRHVSKNREGPDHHRRQADSIGESFRESFLKAIQLAK